MGKNAIFLAAVIVVGALLGSFLGQFIGMVFPTGAVHNLFVNDITAGLQTRAFGSASIGSDLWLYAQIEHDLRAGYHRGCQFCFGKCLTNVRPLILASEVASPPDIDEIPASAFLFG